MEPIPVIAVFDVGKTNKKLFLFDENYKIVFERTARFLETHDEDGDACENLDSLRLSVFASLREIFKHKEFDLRRSIFQRMEPALCMLMNMANRLPPCIITSNHIRLNWAGSFMKTMAMKPGLL